MFFIDLFIIWVLNLIIPNKPQDRNSKVKDEWIIMNDFHRKYEDTFKEDHHDGDEY